MLGLSDIRAAAVAGTFYPADPLCLRRDVEDYLREGRRLHAPHLRPLAIIVPHAGYVYSGPIAGTAYAQLEMIPDFVRRVVLIGPAHYYGFEGLAVSKMGCFATPLGGVPTDRARIDRLLSLPQVRVMEKTHAPEHCLEVQLPFLQVALRREFTLVPVLVGEASEEEVAAVLDVAWDSDETLLVVSSDLSHYHDYEAARRIDQQTAARIENLQGDRLSGDRACGYAGIRGLLRVAQNRGLRVKAIDVRNSGDTAGPPDRVVGYGAFIVFQDKATPR